MRYKIKEYIRHIIIWMIVGLICTVFAERYASYLNIGLGLGVGIVCMSISVKIANKYNISDSAKKIVDIIIMYYM